MGFAIAACSTTALADPPADKSQYTLFNPTPPDLMRPLSADRPDVTESPYTVDAGHVQLEMSFVDYVYDDEDDGRTRVVTVAPFNLKLGLLNNVDVQLVVDSYIHADFDGDGDDTLDGFGDMQLRLKINIWGNDEGDTAFAVMPFVKFPTGSGELSNDHFEGGLILPFAASLPAEFSLGLMAEIDVVYDENDDDYTAEFVQTASIGRQLVGELGGYLEYIGILPLDSDGSYQALVGSGLTYGLNENTQLDAGIVVGLTDDVDDVSVFAGLTIRL